MVELFRHLLGLCPDHATHLNLFDAMLTTGALAFAGPYVARIKSIFWRKPPTSAPETGAGEPHQHSASCDHRDHKH
jgi:hypothetical protein